MMRTLLFVLLLKLSLASLFLQCGSINQGAGLQTPAAEQSRQLFRSVTLSPLGFNPADLAVGDFDGDGRQDLALIHQGSRGLTILSGDGRGGFTKAPNSTFDPDMVADKIALADVNGDRKLDVALAHHDTHGVGIYLGNGNRSFAPAPGSPFAALERGSPHNHGLFFADFNGDGRLDLSTANQNDNSISVLIGDGAGHFTPAKGSPFPVGRSPYNHAQGDVNGDGHVDIVVPNVGSNNVSVLLNDGKANFTDASGSPFRVAERPFYVAVGDLNSDGKPDVVSSRDDVNLLSILQGDGRGGFTPAPTSPFNVGHRPFQIVVTDLNRDRLPDLSLSIFSSDGVAILLGDGRGGFRHAAGSPFRLGRGTNQLALGDFNGDQKSDVVTVNQGSDVVTILFGQ